MTENPQDPITPPGARSDEVRRAITEMGFALTGIASAQPVDAERADYLNAWLAAGQHGEMAYLANHIEKRLDPTRLVPGAKSVICVADLYHDAELKATPEPLPPLAGRIAKYARGDDYHKAIKKRLHRLVDTLADKVPDHTFKTTVDTAPLLERDIAVRAGLGWIGKHTLLINPDPALGSYLLLGEIVTTLPLTPSEPFTTDHCGSCTRCIDACPTDAIAPDGYKLDATRCISYLTIEHRGPIAPEFHEPLSDWIAGCDICQDVCPHNRQPRQQTDTTDLSPTPPTIHGTYHPKRHSFPLLDILNWTADDRIAALTGSALKRLRLDMFKRNALILLGNAYRKQTDPTTRSQIKRAIENAANPSLTDDAEPDLVRDTARTVLKNI